MSRFVLSPTLALHAPPIVVAAALLVSSQLGGCCLSAGCGPDVLAGWSCSGSGSGYGYGSGSGYGSDHDAGFYPPPSMHDASVRVG